MIDRPPKNRPLTRVLSCGCTFLVLGGVLVDREFLRPSPAIAAPYHEAMRTAASAMPTVFGDWAGVDVPVPAAAIRILHPNVIVSRSYHNLVTGEHLSLLVLQVSDAREILGHYPPLCYPSQGWTIASADDRDWTSNGQTFHGIEYVFKRDRLEGLSQLTVDNFLFLYGNRTYRGMSEVETAAQSRTQKLFGAGQVQVVFDSDTTAQRRDAVVAQFAAMVEPLLRITPSADGTRQSHE